jgi:hypothetical protein
MSEQSHNKQVIRRAYDEVYNKGNLAKVDELISRDFVRGMMFTVRRR